MMLLFLILSIFGLVLYFKEIKNRQENEARFQEFVREVKSKSSLTLEEKKEHIRNLYELNGFRIIRGDAHSVTVAKKYFSLGALLMWSGILGVGAVIYVIYYLAKKPDVEVIFFD